MDKLKIEQWISLWETRGYSNGVPDEAPDILETENKVPSYRRVCLAIMKNDCQLQTLGFTREPCSMYNMIKRKELIERGKIKNNSSQMELFDERIRGR